MPNYNQTLQTNNSSLEEIITQLNNMPDAGGGSTSVSTCTVTINSFDANIIFIRYTSYQNGVYEYHEEAFSDGIANLTLNNVVVGGAVYCDNNYGFGLARTDHSRYAYFLNIWGSFRLVPTEDITITIIDDD